MPKMTSVRDVLLVLSVVVSVGKTNGPSSANVSGWFFGATNCANSSLRDGSSSRVFHSWAQRLLLDARTRMNAISPTRCDMFSPFDCVHRQLYRQPARAHRPQQVRTTR